MATQDIVKDKRIVNAIVFVNKEKVNYVSLEIDQEVGEHHRFRLVLDYDALQNTFLTNPLEQIALIGKWVHVELQQGDESGQAYQFKGIIDNTINEGREGKHGYLIVEGKSPTVLLERGKRLDVFSEMTLVQVFENVTEGIINRALSMLCQPTYESKIPFLMQYYESDWEFLQRLSAISGETLYYTGMDLVFGEHKDFPTLEVMYDREISHLRFGSRLLNNTFLTYQYLANRHEILKQDSPERIEHANNYV
ncbi:MAG: phage late control D family protein, partial [Dysgonamonadaceae bacterium]|nr:phage late control D family protein [Dysgonamonadaceae bacterium]